MSEDLVSMRAYLEDQLLQKNALLSSITLKLSQLENKVLSLQTFTVQVCRICKPSDIATPQ